MSCKPAVHAGRVAMAEGPGQSGTGRSVGVVLGASQCSVVVMATVYVCGRGAELCAGTGLLCFWLLGRYVHGVGGVMRYGDRHGGKAAGVEMDGLLGSVRLGFCCTAPSCLRWPGLAGFGGRSR